MICIECKLVRDRKDFLLSGNMCYRCVYNEKMKKVSNKKECKIKVNHKCKECGNKIDIIDDKSRQRRVFCCEECNFKFHKINKTSHWTRICVSL
jgi:hypothetical protein